jgi:pimeloyl-ACP methyl ester carboxylesterase
MMQWVFNRESVAPAFVLARAGYDVWMGNNRGNRFSQTHTTLDNTSQEYWTFDWEQMGTKDTPAVIDFILDKTGHEKINYIGHSEGTTQIMAGASLIPEYYKEKMLLCVFLAPPAAMSNNSVAILEFLAQKPMRLLLLALMNTIKLWNLIPYDYVNQEHAIILCDLLNGKICNMIMSVFCDADPSIDYTDFYHYA